MVTIVATRGVVQHRRIRRRSPGRKRTSTCPSAKSKVRRFTSLDRSTNQLSTQEFPQPDVQYIRIGKKGNLYVLTPETPELRWEFRSAESFEHPLGSNF